MNEAKVVISKEARIGAETLINQMRQENEVSQMPIAGKKVPLYIKDSLDYEKQKYLSFLQFCESRIGKLIMEEENIESYDKGFSKRLHK